MPQVRTGGSEKWARRTAAASEDYKSGVQQPRRSWAAATAAAEGSYQQGVQAAINRKAFGKGVQAAGDQKWAAKAAGKGTARFAQGAAEGQADYQDGVAPYLQTIASTQLPPRGPKGDPRNYDRVKTMGEALRAKKLSLQK